MASIKLDSRTQRVTLLNNMDLSRLNVTALDDNIKIIEKIVIIEKKE